MGYKVQKAMRALCTTRITTSSKATSTKSPLVLDFWAVGCWLSVRTKMKKKMTGGKAKKREASR